MNLKDQIDRQTNLVCLAIAKANEMKVLVDMA